MRFSKIILAIFMAVSCLGVAIAQDELPSGNDSGIVELQQVSERLQAGSEKLDEEMTKLVHKAAKVKVRLEKGVQDEANVTKSLAQTRTAIEKLNSMLNGGADKEFVVNGKSYTRSNLKDNVIRLTEQAAGKKKELNRIQLSNSVLEKMIANMKEQLLGLKNVKLDLATQASELGLKIDSLNTKAVKAETEALIDELESLKARLDSAATSDQDNDEWQSLFNGENLDGWKPKIRGYEYGDNFANTFRVEDGLLKVRYDGYNGKFAKRFGHLFYKDKLSHYLLRIEYRFVGDQIEDGPGWAFRNSGVMLHCQDPESIALGQDFPVSIEMQMLGGDGNNKRPNANVCTPGTHIEMEGKLITRHCLNSSSETSHGDQWVMIEVEVRGDEVIRHKIDGKVVLEYQKPQLDPKDKSAKPLIKDGVVSLKEGFISLQSESHPLDIRKVEIKQLDK